MLEIFQFDFMLRAFAAGLMIAILAPTIGVFLVVKRYSLLADTLSHVSLVGIAASALLGINPVVGALITSSVAALGIEELRARRKLFGESLLALVLSGSLALAIVLFGFARGQSAGLISILFGSITTVSAADLWLISSFGALVLLIMIGGFKTFFLVSYDEDLAKSNGVPVRVLNALQVVLAAVTVSLSLRIVGTLLVGALMVIPVLTAMQFKQSFARTFIGALLISVVSTLIGLFASFYLNLPSGGSIVLTTLVFFVLSLCVSRVRRLNIA